MVEFGYSAFWELTMDASVHGLERIYGRTKMLTEDVLSIIEAGAVVDLGKDERARYLLFYSRPDRKTKVAVVSLDGSVLISILHNDFFLPEGVARVTKRRDHEAQEKFARFIFTQVAVRTAVREREPLLTVDVQVLQRGSVMQTHTCGIVIWNIVRRLDSLLRFEFVATQLRRVFDTVVKSKTGKVNYRIRVQNPTTGKTWKSYRLRHDELEDLLTKPPS
jgi:hypothetical protein